MNLAEATAALSKKESEKNDAMGEIDKLMKLKDENIVAILHVTIFGIDGIPIDSETVFNYQVDELDVSDKAPGSQALGEQVRFHLSSKTGQLWIGCTVTTSTQIDLSSTETETVEAKTKHTAQIGIAEIPEDGELRTDLVATKKSAEFLVDADPDCVTFKLKASLDDVQALLAGKVLELEQVIQEYDDIVVQIKEIQKKKTTTKAAASPAKESKGTVATKKGAGGKKGGNKKGGKSSSSTARSNAAASTSAGSDEVDATTDETKPSLVEQTTEFLLSSANFAIENRAYALFVIAAVGIQFFGEHASV